MTARFSDSTGIPAIPDNDPLRSGPRGFAIRFHLGEHVHTDIVSHSIDAFPTRTVDEFLGFLSARLATDPQGPHPNAIEQFLSPHPAAMKFVQTPKPIPASFARESFYAVSAFKFTIANGQNRYGLYRMLPVAGNEYLDETGAAARGANFLFDEIKERVDGRMRESSRTPGFPRMCPNGDSSAKLERACWTKLQTEIASLDSKVQ